MSNAVDLPDIDTEEKPSDGSDPNVAATLQMYAEICTSHKSIDDFRMKLLGLLPLTSLVGIFGLSKESLFGQRDPSTDRLVASIGVFAAAFTLALFVYEIRGIVRCHDLIVRGRKLEELLGIKGQFFVCSHAKERQNRGNIIGYLDSKFAACFIYSTVFAAWAFLVLHYGFAISMQGCAFWAVGIGLLLGATVYYQVKNHIAS